MTHSAKSSVETWYYPANCLDGNGWLVKPTKVSAEYWRNHPVAFVLPAADNHSLQTEPEHYLVLSGVGSLGCANTDESKGYWYWVPSRYIAIETPWGLYSL